MALRDNVFFTLVAPILGGIVGLVMFMSPLKAVLEVRRTQFLGTLNPLPIAFTIVNCIGWVLYASHQRDVLIFWPNCAALFLGIWMTLSLFPYASAKMRDVIAYCLVTGAAIFAVESFGMALARTSHSTSQLVLGTTANIILIIFYAAPLSEMAKVIRERNSAYLYWPLSVLACLNGLLWFAYGMAIQDWIVYAINGTGAVLAAIQLLLICIFPRREVLQDPVVQDSPRNLKSVAKDAVQLGLNGDLEGAIDTHVSSSPAGSTADAAANNV